MIRRKNSTGALTLSRHPELDSGSLEYAPKSVYGVFSVDKSLNQRS